LFFAKAIAALPASSSSSSTAAFVPAEPIAALNQVNGFDFFPTKSFVAVMDHCQSRNEHIESTFGRRTYVCGRTPGGTDRCIHVFKRDGAFASASSGSAIAQARSFKALPIIAMRSPMSRFPG
jgi:hypothetical protein